MINIILTVIKKVLPFVFTLFTVLMLTGQSNNDVGAWYMYFGNTQFKNSQFGFQTDIQHRNWNVIGDLEQLLLRGAINYELKDKSATIALGYAHITSGVIGESKETSSENRMFLEINLPHKIASTISLRHRFRYEQRFVEEQDFRTRFRYALFMDLPLNASVIEKNTLYLALYNEIFINGEKNIGDNRFVEFFDRNRAYMGLGYVFSSQLKVQLGFMNQSLNSSGKNQLQISLHHKL